MATLTFVDERKSGQFILRLVETVSRDTVKNCDYSVVDCHAVIQLVFITSTDVSHSLLCRPGSDLRF